MPRSGMIFKFQKLILYYATYVSANAAWTRGPISLLGEPAY